jgi:DNA-binding MarR family transcriptional regulator
MAQPLHDELKQSKPFADVEEEVHVSIARTSALLERTVAQFLKPYGITPTQYNVLRILRGAGAGGLCRNELGERLVTPVPDVTRLLDRMADLKLIARQRSDEDRRLVRTHLTAKGLELVNSLDAPLRTAHRERLKHLSRQRLRDLADTLAEIRDRM